MNDNNDTLDQEKGVGKLVPQLPAFSTNTYERYFKRQIHASLEGEVFKPFQVTLEEAMEKNLDRYGIFWTAQSLESGKRRITENVKEIICWAVDIDGPPKGPPKEEQWRRIQASPLPPSLVVESKNGYHVYWHAIDATRERFEEIEKDRLLPFFSADIKATLLVQFLRVPGFFHWKDANDPFLCQVVLESNATYTEAEMLQAFPLTEKKFNERVLSLSSNKKSGISKPVWKEIFKIDCEQALKQLSGTDAVKGEVYSFKPTRTGTLNILVDEGGGKSGTSCWIDQRKTIGSMDGGGPSIWHWLMWHWKDAKKVKELILSLFPEVFKNAAKKEARTNQPLVEKVPHPYDAVALFLSSPYPLDEGSTWYENLIRTENRLFLYYPPKGMWTDLGEEGGAIEEDHFSSNIEGFKAKMRDFVQATFCANPRINWLEEFYKTLRQEVKGVRFEANQSRESIFDVDFRKENFKNGTLHLLEQANGAYSLVFRDHEKENYLLSNNGNNFFHVDGIVNESSQKLTTAEPSEEFNHWLDGLFIEENEETKVKKINTLKVVFGAAVGPFFHQFIFLRGKAGTSKSTAAKICLKLAGKASASVDPAYFGDRFGLAALLRKNINICTDIMANRSWELGIMKQFIDQDGESKLSVEKKRMDTVKATLPAVHIFCANDLPKLFESATVFQRRLLILDFTGKQRNRGEGDDIPHYDKYLWRVGQGAITSFALEGLVSLVKNKGLYSKEEFAMKAYTGWIETSQYIPQFLAAIREEEISGLTLNPDAKVDAKKLYQVFRIWWDFDEGHGHRKDKPTKGKFYQGVEAAGFERKIGHMKCYYIHGIALNSQLLPLEYQTNPSF